MNGNIMGRIPRANMNEQSNLYAKRECRRIPYQKAYCTTSIGSREDSKKTLNFWHLARLGPFASDPSSMTGSNSGEYPGREEDRRGEVSAVVSSDRAHNLK
jgi:hypothetical protein